MLGKERIVRFIGVRRVEIAAVAVGSGAMTVRMAGMAWAPAERWLRLRAQGHKQAPGLEVFIKHQLMDSAPARE